MKKIIKISKNLENIVNHIVKQLRVTEWDLHKKHHVDPIKTVIINLDRGW
jgi:hypothetical protein